MKRMCAPPGFGAFYTGMWERLFLAVALPPALLYVNWLIASLPAFVTMIVI